MKIELLSDRVLLRRIVEKKVARGWIFIPDTAREKPQEAEVVAVGDGKRDENGERVPMTVKAGNRVLIGKYTGQDIDIDDVEHTIVHEDEILATVVS